LSAGLVASILRRSGDSISSLVSAYPNLKRGRASVEVAPGLAGRVMEEVELIAHGPEPMKLDGLRFSGAGWWVLVRPSRTEPIIRVMAEGTDERQVRELVEDYTSVVRQACGRLGREVRR